MSEPPLSPPPPVPLPTAPPERPASRGAAPISWVVTLVLASALGTLLFVAGYLAAGTRGSSTCAAPSEAFAAFCEAYDKLKEQFVDELEDDELAEGAIQGMFEHGVRDPFSGYMPPEEYQRALGDLSGRFSGIGAEMAVENLDQPGNLEPCAQLSDTCVLVVVAPLANSPAEEAGLQAGDIVTAVDGVSVNGTTIQDQIGKVRGEAGTEVTLSLRRSGESLELTIVRAEIVSPEVTSRMLDNQIGYIALHGFSDPSTDQFHAALEALLDDGATSIVFDLRDNPGGYIEAARRIASEFVESGLLFTQESAGDEIKRWEATGGGLATDPDLPVMLLINNGSASASEIVAGALQETGRATLIGMPTYGKDTVQIWSELQNGGGVRITISKWFTPGHNTVAPDGVQPDITVDDPGLPGDSDPILDRAVAELQQRAAWLPTVIPNTRPEALTPIQPMAAYDPGGQRRALA